MKKSILELEGEHVYFRKFKITVIISRYENVNLLFRKDFKSVELLPKTPFTLYFRFCPKNCEGNKQRKRGMYMHKSNKKCIKKGGKS